MIDEKFNVTVKFEKDSDEAVNGHHSELVVKFCDETYRLTNISFLSL